MTNRPADQPAPEVLTAWTRRLAVVSTYLPKRCGIATFACDLVSAMDLALQDAGETYVLAIDDDGQPHAYSERVRFQIRSSVQSDYVMAAEYVAASQADALLIQHEYGLFGGPAGAHILRIMRDVRVPVITTLHTVLAQPGEDERSVMNEVWRLSDRLVVMCHKAEALLREVYVTPYPDQAQISSGTLAYALGAGKAVVSTPYWYAEEMLSDQRGLLVPFNDAHALADAVCRLLANNAECHQMRRRAYTFCRNMVWKKVGRRYVDLVDQVLRERTANPRVRHAQRKRIARVEELPELDFRHLRRLTDDVGIIGHVHLSTPLRRDGYCLDDNALAMAVTALHSLLRTSGELDGLASTFLIQAGRQTLRTTSANDDNNRKPAARPVTIESTKESGSSVSR